MISKSVSEFFAHKRILVSKIFGIALLITLFCSEAIWAHKFYAEYIDLAVQVVGLILITVCVMGRLWSAMYLCGNKTHTLVTQGPYSVVRNPLYFFSFLGVIGIGVTTGSIINLILIVSMFVIYYLPTIIDEEKTLQNVHNEDLDKYMQKVPRLIPNWSLIDEPELYQVRPLDFRKTFFDVMWFVWIYLIIEVLQELHSFGFLPVLFRTF